MDIAQTGEIIKWVIVIGIASILSAVASAIAIIKASKLLPKELKGADLDNISKELSIAEQFDIIATKAANKTIATESRLEDLEACHIELKGKIESQDVIISEQTRIILEQNKKIEEQSKKIDAQEVEISALIFELANYKSYTNALVTQMKNSGIIPLEITEVSAEESHQMEEELVKKRKTSTKRNSKNAP